MLWGERMQRDYHGQRDQDRMEHATMTMTMTHSEKSHINQMRAWPYRQECRGHDTAKKESVALMKLALLARCVHKPTVKDSVQCIKS